MEVEGHPKLKSFRLFQDAGDPWGHTIEFRGKRAPHASDTRSHHAHQTRLRTARSHRWVTTGRGSEVCTVSIRTHQQQDQGMRNRALGSLTAPKTTSWVLYTLGWCVEQLIEPGNNNNLFDLHSSVCTYSVQISLPCAEERSHG